MHLNLLGPRVVFLLLKLTVTLGPGAAAVLRSFDILVLAVAQLTHSRRSSRSTRSRLSDAVAQVATYNTSSVPLPAGTASSWR